MYNSHLENQLLMPDVADALQNYVSIQIDIDDTKIKAAAYAAQRIDIQRVIGQENLNRCIEPNNDSDEALRELVIPAWCYFTYSRALKMFQGNFTDSGFVIESEATDRNIAKSVALEHSSIADVFMEDVIAFLKSEGSQDSQQMESKLSRNIRTFGGKERRACN